MSGWLFAIYLTAAAGVGAAVLYLYLWLTTPRDEKQHYEGE